MLILRNVNGLGDEQEDREGWNEPEVMQLPVREMPVREGRGQEGASQEGEERISRQETDQPVEQQRTDRRESGVDAVDDRQRGNGRAEPRQEALQDEVDVEGQRVAGEDHHLEVGGIDRVEPREGVADRRGREGQEVDHEHRRREGRPDEPRGRERAYAAGLRATTRREPPAGKEAPRSISARSAASTRVRIAFIPAPIPSSGSGSARRVARPAARDMTIAGRSRETNEVARATRKPARRTLSIIP